MRGPNFLGKPLALILALVCLPATLGARQDPAAGTDASSINDQGAYAISFAGRPIGTERFKIQSTADKIEAEGDIEIKVDQPGQPLNLKSTPHLVLSQLWEPQTYVLNQKGTPEFHLEVDFRQSPAKSVLRLSGAKRDDRRDFMLPKDVVILDDNVVHDYQLLIDRFDAKPDKQQTFNAYIPQEATPGNLTVQDAGTEQVDFAGRHETLQHLVVTTDIVRIDLWVDGHHRLQRLLNPASMLEAVRTK